LSQVPSGNRYAHYPYQRLLSFSMSTYDLMDTGLYKSIVWVRALIDILERRGIAGEELFLGTGASPELLGDDRAQISLREWNDFVQRALVLTQDPALGISIVSTSSDHLHHIVGPIAVACASLREAIRMFERYVPLFGNAHRFELVEEGNRAYLVQAPVSVTPPHPQFEAELVLGLLYRSALRFAKRDGNDADEVWFTHAAPAYAGRYAEVFRCPVSFGRPRNAIVFSRVCLDARYVHGNSLLLEVLREGADRLLLQQGTPTLPERVRAILLHEVDLRRVTTARIATLLKLHTRTFRTQLIDANVSWSQLLDEARCRIACQQLQRGDTQIRELSERLGFSRQTAFSRAFKRWMGMAPSKYAQDVAARRGAEQARAERRADSTAENLSTCENRKIL
jgi:AraC-like DNA-binding protein